MRLLAIRLTVLLLLTAFASPLLAQTEQELADLKTLFEKDPAEGFVQAAKLFETPKQAGDLEGMMKVFRVTWKPSCDCKYGAVLENMIDVALPVATQAGNWAAAADLYLARADWANCGLEVPQAAQTARRARHVHSFELATEAYARSGAAPPVRYESARGNYAIHLSQLPKMTADGRAQHAQWGGERAQLGDAISDAVGEGRDTEAVRLLDRLLGEVSTDSFDAQSEEMAEFVASMVWLRGAERLLPRLRQVAAREPLDRGSSLAHYALFAACVAGWSGRPDAYGETAAWLWDVLSRREKGDYNCFGKLSQKMLRFGQAPVANKLVGELAAKTLCLNGWNTRESLMNAVNPGMSPDLRERLLYEWLSERLRHAARSRSTPQANIMADTCETYWHRIVTTDPPRGPQWWAEWFARGMVDVAGGLSTTDQRLYLLTKAAGLFDLAKLPALAAEARELAKAMSSGDPRVLLQCAVAVAQGAAKEGQWPEVQSGLTGAVAGQPPSGALVTAYLLLQQACLKQKDTVAAGAWLDKAGAAVPKAGLSSTERANTCVQLAGLATGPGKVTFLQQAQTAAKEAGLDLLSEKIEAQLTEAALSSGDLPAAEKALLQQINRLEAKREQLAFDRLLRQQWFADNLGPYRQLLRVAAQEGKAPLALWVGEKMRGRALQDQLNWQKVDWGLKLAPALRARLEGLRKARNETYALLQHVMGGEAMATDTRGSYLPIRGSYIPVRGGLSEQSATAAQVKQLRQRLDALAKEEAALAAAIREQVPAYAEASTQKTLSGMDLLTLVSKQPDLAFIEYTLCDEGLVVVAAGPGQAAQVALLPVKGEDLWQQIGTFRQQIWERKPEADATAAQLYELLVKPVEGCLANAKRLWVVGDGALQLVPFGALQAADKRYLAQRLAVAMSPSLSLTFADFGPRNPGQGALVMAAPDTGATPLTEGDDKRGSYLPIRGMYIPVRGSYLPIRGEGVSSALTLMANVPLPGAKAEGEALAAKLRGAKFLTGKEANRRQLLAQASQCDLLHIATHGYADPDTPEFSGLLLAGEGHEAYAVLTAQDVYMWPLRARLVTLSACQTALGQSVEGEGLLGLTRAFIYAGAQDVLCTLWPVADESTKTLMTAFYDNLKPGVHVETALQQAQLSLAAQPATAHPFFWAGFTAVRGPE